MTITVESKTSRMQSYTHAPWYAYTATNTNTAITAATTATAISTAHTVLPNR